MKEDILFKKTPFGGFDRAEVISYIQQLKETQQKYKVMIDEKEAANRKLASDNIILAGQVESLKKAQEENIKRLEEVEAQFKSISAKYEMLARKADQVERNNEAGKKLAGDTVKMCDELVETASATAKEIVRKAEEESNEIRSKLSDVLKQAKNVDTMPAKDVRKLLKKIAEELENG